MLIKIPTSLLWGFLFFSYPTLLSDAQILLLKVLIFKSFEVLFLKNYLKRDFSKMEGAPFFSCKMSLQFINFISGETVRWLVPYHYEVDG
jgi:hypothetical protein